jgi:hypothetical protein
MKTSFAKTLRYISNQSKEKPCDILHKGDAAYKPIHDVLIDDQTIVPESLYVADAEDSIDTSKSFINFLASSKLKSQYDDIYKVLTIQKDMLMARLGKESYSSDCEKELFSTFKNSENDTIFSILERLTEETSTPLPTYNFKYNDIFDTKGKVREFVEKNKEKLQTYFKQYATLIANSNIFRSKDGLTFGTYQASQLETSVRDNSFFKVDHKILLHGEDKPIESIEEFSTRLNEEKDKILSDEELRKIFISITSSIDKNSELRALKDVLEKHPDWVPHLLDYDEFKKKVWKGHLSKTELRNLLVSCNNIYQEKKAELQKILEKAGEEQERWKSIIELYNARFDVPFIVEITNQRDIILKKEAAKLKFSYKEDDTHVIEQEKESLEKILSRGEKRAFHILQLIFELEARKSAPYTSYVVMDDIADSFDYQNKYAIIEYIKDLSEYDNDKFCIIILTHNFDFYRTLASRISFIKQQTWMAVRMNQGVIKIEKGMYIKNLYEKALVGHDDEDKKFISMIPFVRNLIEYTKGVKDNSYLTLTCCMHLKQDTHTITEKEIIDIIQDYTFGKGMKRKSSTGKIYDLIMSTADEIEKELDPNIVLIENKIVLSIAIRLLAEKHMHDRLITAGKTEEDLDTHKNQTSMWTNLYKNMFPNDSINSIIERVNMMTPEIIHLNSFMFEPLVDLSLTHLLRLYRQCKNEL